MTVGSALSLSASILHLALAVGCVIHVLRSRKRASATILWILTVIYLPWIGALAYMVFGVTRVRRRIEARQSKARMLLPYLRELPGLQDAVHNEADHPSFSGACPEVFREFFRLLDNLTAPENQELQHLKDRYRGEFKQAFEAALQAHQRTGELPPPPSADAPRIHGPAGE